MLRTKVPMIANKLKDFVHSPSDFKIIFNVFAKGQDKPENFFLNNDTQRICILDSSFNPPHLGHLQLAIDSLNHVYSNEEISDEKVLLLLLSVKNADKIKPQPASFKERLEMMCLMAEYMHKEMGINVSVGLTKHAKFIDKSSSAINYIKDNQLQPIESISKLQMTFLVGFDTLIRIFNSKYYLPEKLSVALKQFMKTNDLFCLARQDSGITYNEQINYVNDIKLGKHEDIPTDWHSRVIFVTKNDDTSMISSSSIRKQVEQNNNKQWENQVVPTIKQYIKDNKLYLRDSYQ